LPNKNTACQALNDIQLKEKAAWVWRETLAIHRRAPETRIASSLSAVEIFVALYYGGILEYDPKLPLSVNRDRCVISKGHGSICMYPILADLEFFSINELQHVCEKGSFLGGIPDPVIPGYETVNGSLGHGLGVGSGMALALNRKGSERQVYVVCGDGELHEGANWEAIMFASHHGLSNLNLIVDNNQISMLGFTDDIISHKDLIKRFESFGWNCLQVDGHEVSEVKSALKNMKQNINAGPKVLVARTLKGHGVPGLENAALSHIINPSTDIIDDILRKKE
jgi:transketolase